MDSSEIYTTTGTLSGIITPSSTTILTTDATWTSNPSYRWYGDEPDPLSNVTIAVDFSKFKKELNSYLVNIKKNKIIFSNIKMKNGRIQPFEIIKDIIKKKVKMDLILTIDYNFDIKYKGIKFKKIINDINILSGNLDFSKVKVKFTYDKIFYLNKGLAIEELRKDKLEKIKEIE